MVINYQSLCNHLSPDLNPEPSGILAANLFHPNYPLKDPAEFHITFENINFIQAL